MSKPKIFLCVSLLAWSVFSASFAAAQSSDLDKYGGAKTMKCANATGWFHPEKIGSQWWLCTPLGNAFFMNGMDGVSGGDNTWNSIIQTKYGSTMAWTTQANRRLLSWGFNTLATYTYGGNLPFATDGSFPLDSNGLHSQPVKMPFTLMIRPALYAMTNPPIWNGTSNQRLLSAPVKNMLYGHSPFYTGYVSSGIADYYDSGIATWMQQDLQKDSLWTTVKPSPYLNYLIGITSDDGDQANGFGNSPDFPTVPSGYNNYNLAMQVAAMSPVQTANSVIAYGGGGFVYGNKQIYSKLALRNALATEYVTVAALNTAWGSSYTTFDSSGVCVGSQPITCASNVSADSVGTGDGTTLTFSRTLSHTTISGFSLQILVAGTPVAGDLCNNYSDIACSVNTGTIYGPNASGTINYSTDALSITFTAGHAPASGAVITAIYVANGWGVGTGFLDEDARPAHTWMGTDWIAMSNANPNVKTDMNTFLGQMAAQYFQTCQTQLKAVFPNIMYLGPDSLSTWGGPPPAPVLKAAGQYLDAFLTADSNVFTQAEMDFIEQNFGDKPYFGSFYSTANPDSALSAYPNTVGPGGFATQATRGQAYYNDMVQMLQTAHTTSGNFPYIGTIWWQYIDNPSEKLNWGIITHLDNAYDGHEAVTATVPCSPPLSQYTCGQEAGNYGDVVTPVTSANLLWITKP